MQLREEHARQLEEINSESESLQAQILEARSNSGNSILHSQVCGSGASHLATGAYYCVPLPTPSGLSQNEVAALQKEYDDFIHQSKQELEKMHCHLVSGRFKLSRMMMFSCAMRTCTLTVCFCTSLKVSELDILTVHKTGIEQQLSEVRDHSKTHVHQRV